MLTNPATSWNIFRNKEQVLDTLFQCVLALPTKTPIYGTMIGLINLTQPDFGLEVNHNPLKYSNRFRFLNEPIRN